MIQLREYQKEAVDSTIDQLMKSPDPCLIDASVSSGKTFMIAAIMEHFIKLNKNCLCLTMTKELIEQNSECFAEYVGSCSVYCASMKMKNYKKKAIFASPQSIHAAIKRGEEVKDKKISLLIVDECHNINYEDKKTVYTKIIENYRMVNPKMRILGLTGTPFRGVGSSIYGGANLFKHITATISMFFLIKSGFVVRPIFGVTSDDEYDFSDCKVQRTGKYKESDLADVAEGKDITKYIVKDIIKNSQERTGVLIFASTLKHCEEILTLLPSNSCMITGKTPEDERSRLIKDIRAGKIKYTVNLNVLTVGFNAPIIDHVVFMRPTHSRVLWIQAIGRGVRQKEGKEFCLVSDYAGNLDRLGDVDDPIINSFKRQQAKELPFLYECPECYEMNTARSRRCIGYKKGQWEKERCEYMFIFKECFSCGEKNDVTARMCLHCGIELVDPNDKLTLKAATKLSDTPTRVKVDQTFYSRHLKLDNQQIYIKIEYLFMFNGNVKSSSEYYNMHNITQRTINFFFNLHCKSEDMQDLQCKIGDDLLKSVLNCELRNPSHIYVKKEKGSKYINVTKKVFDED